MDTASGDAAAIISIINHRVDGRFANHRHCSLYNYPLAIIANGVKSSALN